MGAELRLLGPSLALTQDADTRVLWLDPADVIPPTREGVTVLTATELTEIEQDPQARLLNKVTVHMWSEKDQGDRSAGT